MFKVLPVLVLLSTCVGSGELHSTVDYSGCLPCTYRPNSTAPCQCGYNIGLDAVSPEIECDITTGEVDVPACWCLTYNEHNNQSVVGYCPYTCDVYSDCSEDEGQQLNMTRNNFNNFTCGRWNRAGRLCSQCIPEYGIPFNSYDLHCVKCSSQHQIKEVFKFLAVSLIPPTVLCIVVAVLHLNVLHPPWSAFVLVAQVLSTPMRTQSLLESIYDESNSDPYSRQTEGYFTAIIYGPWNLDFFRGLYKPACISPNITATQAHAIEGAFGLYPLLLIVVFYSFITLRDHGYKVIVTIWKPFHFLLSRLQNKFNIKTSLVDTFATFLLLSYMNIGFAAVYILTPLRVWRPDGSSYYVVHFNPSLTYFDSSHIGYALITLLLVFVVLIIPIVLLFLYPCRCFHKCLNHFHLQLLPLHAFADAIQGCYKDGTNGTGDCRYFAGLQLILRLFSPFLFLLTENISVTLVSFAIVLTLYITLFVLAQPYKVNVYNRTDVPLLLTLLLTVFTTRHVVYMHVSPGQLASIIVRGLIRMVCVCGPLIYLVICLAFRVKYIITHRTWCQKHTEETDQLLPHA